MDRYVQIMRKYPCHAIASGRNIPFTLPYPLNPFPNPLSTQHCKGQPVPRDKQNPSYKTHIVRSHSMLREAAELFIVLSIIPPHETAEPRT
jgi:hypothetical protein